MSYKPTVWSDGETPVNAENLNNMEKGIAEAHEGVETSVKTVNGITPDEKGNVDIPDTAMQPLTFTGAATATYDGSKAVSVEIPQGGGGDWRLFQKIEVTEEIQYFLITKTPEGEPFTCNDILLKVKAVNRNGANLSSFKLCINPSNLDHPTMSVLIATQLNEFGNKAGDRYYVFSAEFGEFGVKSRTLDCLGANIFQTTSAHASASGVYNDGTTYSALRHEGINAILLFANNNFMVGDIIEIYVK